MNLFSTRDPQEHRHAKRQITTVYNMSNLLQSEPAVDTCTELFKHRLEQFADEQKPVDLGAWLQYYAFDVVGELTFAKKLGFLEQGDDVDGMMKAIEGSLSTACYSKLKLTNQGMLAYASLCGQVSRDLLRCPMGEFRLLKIEGP